MRTRRERRKKIEEQKETNEGKSEYDKKLVSLNLDGTIADTVESIAHAVNRVLEHFGLVPRPVEAFKLLRLETVSIWQWSAL